MNESAEGWWSRLTTPEPKDVIVGELAGRGHWVVLNVDTHDFWPVTTQRVEYRGHVLWVLPLMKDLYPAVVMKVPEGGSREACELLLSRFLSSLSWTLERGFLIYGFGGGGRPAPFGRQQGRTQAVCEDFDLSYLPEPQDRRGMLALALMREGRGLNHPAFAFLSFFKVLEVAIPNGKERGAWVVDTIPKLNDYRAKEAIARLEKAGIKDVPNHLRESGRHAIAHAGKDTEAVVDPDEPADYRRLSSELPIVTALAELAVEEFLGVETRHTVWKKHLYELEGFKAVFGERLVSHFVAGETVDGEPLVDVPNITVRLRRRDPYPPLTDLKVIGLGSHDHTVFLRFGGASGLIEIAFSLDFAAERLEFNLFGGLVAMDDGTVAAAESIAEVRRFSMEYFGNGQLEIYNAETGALLSRKDAFIPENMMLDHEEAQSGIEMWRQIANERRDRDARYGEELRRFAEPYRIGEVRIGSEATTTTTSSAKSSWPAP